MKNESKMILKDDKGIELEVEILFTFDNKKNNKTYVVYSDHSKDIDDKEKVYAGIYDSENKILNPIEDKEDYALIENILSSIES